MVGKQVDLYRRRVKYSEETGRFISQKDKNIEQIDRFISENKNNQRANRLVSIKEESTPVNKYVLSQQSKKHPANR